MEIEFVPDANPQLRSMTKHNFHIVDGLAKTFISPNISIPESEYLEWELYKNYGWKIAYPAINAFLSIKGGE